MTTAGAIDARLAQHPLHAVYWSMIATLLYAQIASVVLVTVFPDFFESLTTDGAEVSQAYWLFGTVISFLVLIRLCQWAEKITGTPFAGQIDTTSNWLGIAAVMGPIVLIGSSALVGALFGGGNPEWAYNDDFDANFFSQANLGLMMFVYVVILAPLVEEIGFRGVALGCLLGRGLDPRIAVGVTSLAFAALHLQYSALGMLTVLATGVFLGWLRIASGSISAPIVAHMAANGASLWLLSIAGA